MNAARARCSNHFGQWEIFAVRWIRVAKVGRLDLKALPGVQPQTSVWESTRSTWDAAIAEFTGKRPVANL